MNVRPARALMAFLLCSGVMLPGCADSPPTSEFLPHVAGAEVVNVTCDDGTWGKGFYPGGGVDIREGESVDLEYPVSGKISTIVCVPSDFPRLGDAWIGRWATVSVMKNEAWRDILRSLLTGSDSTNPLQPGGKPVYYQLVVDPNGVIRHYAEGQGLPAALEYNPVTGGLIGYQEGPETSPMGVPPTGAMLLLHDIPPRKPGIPVTGRIASVDPELRLDWHDYAVLPSGNVLAIGYQTVEETPSTDVRLFRSVPGCPARIEDYRYTLRTRIVEYSPTGSQVRVWRSEDHLPPHAAVPVPVVLRIPGEVGEVCAIDVEHANAVDVTPDGEVVVGFRNSVFSTALLTWPAGDVVWTFGGKGDRALEVTKDPLGGPRASHDARITRVGGQVYLHLLDNNSLRGQSRYVRYRVDSAARTAELVSDVDLECHGRPCYSIMMGSVSVLGEEGGLVEILANPGSVLGEDLTVYLEGVLLHYRGDDLVGEIRLGDWWAYRVVVLPGEPWKSPNP